MCGIAGFYSHNGNLSGELITALKKLEYRGYDSSGIAILGKKGVFSQKAVGKVAELEKLLTDSDNLETNGHIGIAHTRWATHGQPSQTNAHPHHSQDGKIWLVHNGIIENYRQLKAELESSGTVFYSQTDTEVLANLIATKYQGDLKQAVSEALTEVRGAYSLLIFANSEPDRLIAVKKGSPLVLGIGENELIVASDVSALIHKTREVIYLEDNQLLDIYNGSYTVYDQGLVINKAIEYVDWEEESANKNGYEHFLIKEIMEQPDVIQDSIRGRILSDIGEVVFGGLNDIRKSLQAVDKVLILGIGTSYYAGKIGQLYFEELSDMDVDCQLSCEFRYKKNNINSNTWVIVLSQSGETADTIAAVEEARQKGAIITGIVNTVGSTISRLVDCGVYNHIGPEISVASTKAFTSQAVLILMHAVFISNLKSQDRSKSKTLLQAIDDLPTQIKELLDTNSQIESIARKYVGAKNFMYIGRKYNYPVALEGALKLKEISYIHAEGLSGGELKHGFIALVDEHFPTFALASQDEGLDKIISNIEEIKARNGKVIALTTTGCVALDNIADDLIYVPKSSSDLVQPIINNVAQQLFAYHCACLRGNDVDKPRNLAKSVTVE
jgi:glutamine---fructose-6-phosphate transaminase (isomerizing)